MWAGVASLLFHHDHGWSCLVEIQSRPVRPRCICTHAHIYCVSPLTLRRTHTYHTWDGVVCVFAEKPIFSPHEATTGGIQCYINAPWFSVLVLSVLWALLFTFLPIDSNLLEHRHPANQTGPLGYQHSYDVSVAWYVGRIICFHNTLIYTVYVSSHGSAFAVILAFL